MNRHQEALASGLNEAQRRVLTIQSTSGKRIDELLSEICRARRREPDEIPSMLADAYGLGADSIEFLMNLAEQADADAIDRDKRALSEAFSYRDYSRDLNWLLDDLDRPFHAAPRILGLSPYGAAAEFVLDCYYEKGALEPIVRIKSAQAYRAPGTLDELLHHLQKAQRSDLIERLWVSIVRRARQEFFVAHLDRGSGKDPSVLEAQQKLALEGYDLAIDWMTRLGRFAVVQQLTEEREALREGRLATLPPVSDPRSIDEPVFWELITRAHRHGATTRERLAILGELLRAFKAVDLKRFGSIYARNMRRLYHWNVWALAYAARGGCSDDAFQEFRTWLILQGDPELLELAITDPVRAASRVPSDPDLPDGTCVWMIEETYLQRKGAPLELPTIDLAAPKGREWPEEQFETIFPELVRHYATVNER